MKIASMLTQEECANLQRRMEIKDISDITKTEPVKQNTEKEILDEINEDELEL